MKQKINELKNYYAIFDDEGIMKFFSDSKKKMKELKRELTWGKIKKIKVRIFD